MMLDEAITHAREVAQRGGECAKDHEQLAEWLEELRKLKTIAATLGRPKAKSHPYGYEPDTGAFDTTRCECGCINDISATYCNDCGGEIEIDMNAEKEIYHTPAHMVFVEKHDDGSLEFAGKRYIAATQGTPEIIHCGDCENAHFFYPWRYPGERSTVEVGTCALMAEGETIERDGYCAFAERREQ